MSNTADPTPGALSPTALGIQAALISGDPGLAYSLVSRLMEEGVAFDQILFDVLAPLQHDIGTRWLQAEYRIADEHAASAAVETLLALFAGTFETPAEGTHVVVSCAEGEDHSLPARMVAAYLIYLGWRVTFLGATLPAADLGAFLDEHQPAALLLSCTAHGNLLGARACIKAAHRAGVPVIAGGFAFGANSHRAEALGADGWVPDPRQLEHLLDSWDPDLAAAEAKVLTDEDAIMLADALPGLIETAVTEELGGVSVAPTRADLSLLGESLTAAVLLNDRSLIDDFVTWHQTRHQAHTDVLPTNSLLGTLSKCLPSSATRAQAMLARR